MVNDYIIYLPAAFAFATVSFGTLAVVFTWEALRTISKRRRVLARLDPDRVDESGPGESLFRAGSGQTGIAAVIARIPFVATLSLRLKQAGMEISPFSFLVLTIGSGAAFGLTAWLMWGSVLLAVPIGLVATWFPELHLRSRRTRRLRKFEEQFPEAVDLLGRAIRAGHPLSAGIRMVADEAPNPTASEFRQVFEEQRFGLPFEDALLGLADRNDLVDVRIFATAVLIQREVGGNLAEILDKIAKTVRSRFTVQRQLRVYTAQGRLSGYVLAALPIVLALTIFALDPDYARMLIDEMVGRYMVIAALVLQVIGFIWIRKVVDIEI
jgi:tight adherence protein B